MNPATLTCWGYDQIINIGLSHVLVFSLSLLCVVKQYEIQQACLILGQKTAIRYGVLYLIAFGGI